MSNYSLQDVYDHMRACIIDHFVEDEGLSRSWARRKVQKLSVDEVNDLYRTHFDPAPSTNERKAICD